MRAIPANVTTQMNYLKQLGATYYRVNLLAYDSVYWIWSPPRRKRRASRFCPFFRSRLVPADSAQTNYSSNYSTGYAWADYAISKGYALPYWEIGNEAGRMTASFP